MTPLDYDYLRKLLKERSGLTLSADKQYLVESRLLPVARRAGVDGLGGLAAGGTAARRTLAPRWRIFWIRSCRKVSAAPASRVLSGLGM